MGSVQEQAGQAFVHLGDAQQALAQADFHASEQAFTDAQTVLSHAQQELEGALSASKYVLQYIDVTGTVRSGSQLLEAGQHLTDAGKRVSSGLAVLTQVQVGSRGPQPASAVIDAITYARQEFASAADVLGKAERSLAEVESPLLPEDIQQRVDGLRTAVPRIADLLSAFVDQADTLLFVLGADQQRQYLLVFENNHEIRPTGGFIGSVALVNVDRGAVENIDVQTVYDPDGQLKEFIAPPDPLLSITDRWYMRDANWFINYSTSARKIADFFEKEGGPTVDGVIALTPEVIAKLLAITGPIDMPTYNVTVTAENFFEVTQQEVTYEYAKELNRPKQFLADLAPILLNRLFSAQQETSLQLLGVLSQAVHEKSLLLYFRDDDIQAKLVGAGWSGDVPAGAQGLLAVNNANIGGHKSDQFVEQEIDYRSEIKENGDVGVVLTIRRTHRGPQEMGERTYPEGENPAVKDNIVYQRVLVPEGTRLLDAQGFTSASDIPRFVVAQEGIDFIADPDVAAWQQGQTQHSSGTWVGHEAGYTFFANWMVTAPGQTTVALYRYTLPNHADVPSLLDGAERYSVTLIKQPGDTRTTVRVNLALPAGTRVAHLVPQEGITLGEDGSLTYRGALRSDVVVGAVYEKE